MKYILILFILCNSIFAEWTFFYQSDSLRLYYDRLKIENNSIYVWVKKVYNKPIGKSKVKYYIQYKRIVNRYCMATYSSTDYNKAGVVITSSKLDNATCNETVPDSLGSFIAEYFWDNFMPQEKHHNQDADTNQEYPPINLYGIDISH
jgi:hypothetical protein